MSNDLKTQICDALAAWIRQRPGLQFADYGDVKVYSSEARSIARDKRDAETLLIAVRHNDSITAEKLRQAFNRSFSGRLELKIDGATDCKCGWKGTHKDVTEPHTTCPECIKQTDMTHAWVVALDYTTGQYWPTEYRKAAAAVLAGALWAGAREDGAFLIQSGREPGGDDLRMHFRREFGSNMQRRWFN